MSVPQKPHVQRGTPLTTIPISPLGFPTCAQISTWI